MSQLLCQLCHSFEATSTLLKCCQLFVCSSCHQLLDKASQCSNCQRIFPSKKWGEPDPQLFEVVSSFYASKPVECSRCDSVEEIGYCEECEEKFCGECVSEIHAVGLYQAHQITRLEDTRGLLEARKNATKDELCLEHHQRKDFVCECNHTPLCGLCLKTHREACARRSKPFSEFKKEYFSTMLLKLEHISKYKEYLRKTESDYQAHFDSQRTVYKECSDHVKTTLDNFIKLLEYKKSEVSGQLESYWEECQQVFRRNEANVQLSLNRFDDLARLIERFSEKAIGLEYLEKRLNVKNLEFESFSFKVNGLEGLEKAIVEVSANGKKWPSPTQVLQLKQRNTKSSINPNTTPSSTTPEMLTQIHQNCLLPRPLKLIASTNQIQYSFIHLPYQKLKYEIEFGVGIKMKGQEVFKRVEANENGKGVIEGLHPASVYRVRMRVEKGSWSDVFEVATLPLQGFLVQNTNFARGDSKGTITLLRSGTLYAQNGYQFGIHSWEIRLMVDKTGHHESQTACISIGISNKEYKKAVFVGTTINYGYQRENLRLRVILDCDNNRLSITDMNKQQEETYQNIPQLPVYPTIVNKGNSMVQVAVTFH